MYGTVGKKKCARLGEFLLRHIINQGRAQLPPPTCLSLTHKNPCPPYPVSQQAFGRVSACVCMGKMMMAQPTRDKWSQARISARYKRWRRDGRTDFVQNLAEKNGRLSSKKRLSSKWAKPLPQTENSWKKGVPPPPFFPTDGRDIHSSKRAKQRAKTISSIAQLDWSSSPRLPKKFARR